jgi:hypothetical protein
MSASFEIFPNSVKQSIATEFGTSSLLPQHVTQSQSHLQEQRPSIQNRSYIASGAFGATVKPALPNYNETTGQWIEYPENITKIFYKKTVKNNAVRKQRAAKNILKSNNLRINNYKYNKYTVKNLPNSIKSEIFKVGLKENTPLELVRLPNLGNDIIYYINKIIINNKNNNKNIIDRVFKISFDKSIGEIYKIIMYVNNIYQAGYIHGDIKCENLMMKNDGTLTLIDYDMFETRDNYYNFLLKYNQFGLKHHPPEVFLFFMIKDIQKLIQLKVDESTLTLEQMYNYFSRKPDIQMIIKQYVDYVSILFPLINIQMNEDIFYTNLLINMQNFMKYYKQNNNGMTIKEFFKWYLLEKFDTYGTGVSLFATFNIFYNFMFRNDEASRKKNITNKLFSTGLNNMTNSYYNILRDIQNILYKMLHPIYNNRLHIQDAVQEMNNIIMQNSGQTTKRSRNFSNSENAKKSKKITNYFKKNKK